MSDRADGPRTEAFDYDLPRELIAQRPLAERERSRLLVLDRSADVRRHLRFYDIVDLLRPGDVLVLNETRVLPARVRGRAGEREVEVLFVRPAGGADEWFALLRPGRKLRPGDRIALAASWAAEVLPGAGEAGLRRLRLHGTRPACEEMERAGEMPLPPYIRRRADAGDRERYQTVYARVPGAVAAPTAGLHFTEPLLAQIAARGVRIVRGALHVGPGTFRPVRVEDPGEHRMDPESYEWPEESAAAVNEAARSGGRIVAVGTTVARLLESVALPEGRAVRAGSGWTDLFIRPPFQFRAVDALVTNFHLPRSTLLMLVAAFAGRERILAAYEEAVRQGYRFYSYGDAMLIL